MAAVPPFPARPLTRTSAGPGSPDTAAVLAVDIGGTKLAAGLVGSEGQLSSASQVPTPTEDDAGSVWRALAELVEELAASGERRVVACGVGCGGPMTAGGELVSPLNIRGWRRFPLRRQLSELTRLPTYVDNDAKALAVGEGWCGAATGRSDFLGMVVSTGVGGGVVVDGRLIGGRLGNAGHVGHVVVEPDGRECSCGGRGCLEAEASGTAIAAATGRPAAFASPEVVERTGTLVGRAVASVAALCDLDLAVVGGSVALGFGRPFFDAAQRELSARARLDFCADARIVPAALGEDGPLVGAGAVGWLGVGCRLGGGR
ncbi:MAG: ROK family protein [Acidimicrobiales bacterium]